MLTSHVQILLDVVLVFNIVSSISREKHCVKLLEEGMEVILHLISFNQIKINLFLLIVYFANQVFLFFFCTMVAGF